jgi:hypothetical protein
VDIRHHVRFGYTFHVDNDIVAEAVFEVRSMPPLPSDNCVGDIANASDIPVLVNCSMNGEVAAPKSLISFPVGTPKGTICVAGLTCRPDAFVRLFAVSGDTGKITAVMTLSGPR